MVLVHCGNGLNGLQIGNLESRRDVTYYVLHIFETITQFTMTPTLIGRWQSRIFLLATIGVLVSLPFALIDGIKNFHAVYFWVLLYVGIFGVAWDILYTYLQKFLWDHDWPGAIQLITAIFEAIFLALMIHYVGLPHIPRNNFNWVNYAIHYSVVWIFVYAASWIVMRLLFPRARYRGGAWIGKWPKVS